MRNEIKSCRKAQDALLEDFMTAGERAHHSADLRLHLEGCASCQRYWYNLLAVRSGYPRDPLYSPSLRTKALHRLANRDQAIRIQCLPLVVLSSLLSLSISYVFPAWLVSRLCMQWTASASLAYGVSLTIMLVIGMLVTAAAAISLAERGYINLSDAEGVLNSAKSQQ